MNFKPVFTGLAAGALAWGGWKIFNKTSAHAGNVSGNLNTGSDKGSRASSSKNQSQKSMTEKKIQMLFKQTIMAELGKELAVLNPQIKKLADGANQLKKQQTAQAQDASQPRASQADKLTKEAEELKANTNKLK